MKKLLLIITTILILVGCSTGDSSNETLTVYSPNSEGIINAVIPLFEEKENIKVKLISAGTGELMKRVDSEKEAPLADVMFGGTNSQYVSNRDLFEDYVSPEEEHTVEAYKSKDANITNYVLDGRVLIVNKDLGDQYNIKGYADLLNPDLKGKISSADASNSSSAFSQLINMLLAHGGVDSDEAWEYVANLIEQLDGKVAGGSSNVYKSVVEGEMVVGLTYEDPVIQLLKDGADNVEIIYPAEGAHFTPSSMGIVKGANNREAAEKFIDFVLGEEVQSIFGNELTNRPVRQNVEVGEHLLPLEEIEQVHGDMEYIGSKKEDIVKRYTELFASLQ